MTESIQIKGGAGEFEAAVIAVVLDHIGAEKKARRTGRDKNDNRLSPWVRAIDVDRPTFPAHTSPPF